MIEYSVYIIAIMLSLGVGFTACYSVMHMRILVLKEKLLQSIKDIDDDQQYGSTIVFKADVVKAVERIYEVR